VAPELEAGDGQSIEAFYNGRLTDCNFLADPEHYEYPRAQWILQRVSGGHVLEIGCGNGGMTRLMAERVRSLIALDASGVSLRAVEALGLANVSTVQSLVEEYAPTSSFDCIVMAEVVEHLRNPAAVIRTAVDWLAPGGSMLLTTPNGHWESNEHLHVFSLTSFAQILGDSGAESMTVSYLRDSIQRRRWLVGQLTTSSTPHAADDFSGPQGIVRHRCRRRTRGRSG
jgi:2-polyprenyl-3-methyl-5-hydroxy-6-metoxy-1,4-benzoquinol methylase